MISNKTYHTTSKHNSVDKEVNSENVQSELHNFSKYVDGLKRDIVTYLSLKS